ncbi:MAG: hypothetical protein ACR2RE_19795 [Geminicoccaceae bacterium]
MKTSRSVLIAAVFAVFAQFGTALAADLSSAEGQVVFTVVGKIEKTNRAGFDAFEDPFTNYHDRKFDNAAEFDHAMLEALGMHEVEVNYEGWPRTIRLAGPLLSDVLVAVGADPDVLTVLALDGFAVELSKEDLANETWIVAIQLDGSYMNLGQRGPVWVVFDPGEDKTITAEEEGTWPWAAFFMQVD